VVGVELLFMLGAIVDPADRASVGSGDDEYFDTLGGTPARGVAFETPAACAVCHGAFSVSPTVGPPGRHSPGITCLCACPSNLIREDGFLVSFMFADYLPRLLQYAALTILHVVAPVLPPRSCLATQAITLLYPSPFPLARAFSSAESM